MSKYNCNKRGYLIFINFMLTLALIAASIFSFAVATKKNAVAATATVPINMIQYGWYTDAIEANVINTRPEFLVSTSYAGPWSGNADIGKLQAAGIKYFEYIDGGYEGSVWQPIPNDLQSNLNYINNIAAAGAYGVFLDEVSPYPSGASLYYLEQIAARAHSLGLKVAFNCGANSWSDSLMNYCDFINSSEIWQNGSLTASQIKWASRTWLLTYNVYDAAIAAALTNSALSQGIRAHYACTSYMALPSWLGYYVAQISFTSPASFSSNPSGVEVWIDYSYQGVTPLTTVVAPGNHHIAFSRNGYSTLEGDFISDGTAFTISADLLSRQFTSTGTEVVSWAQAPASFTSNPSGVGVWLDYSYKGVTPLTIDVAEGNHHIAFALDGYSTLEGDFIAANTAFTISGDLLSRQFTSTGTEVISWAQAPVSFTSNPSGVEVWIDYSYKGVTPLTIDVAEGNHRIAFALDGYSTLVGDILVDNNVFTIIGDLLSGEVIYNETVNAIPEDTTDNSETEGDTPEDTTDNSETEGATPEDTTDEVIEDIVAGDDGAKEYTVYFGITKLTTLGAILVKEDLNRSLCGGGVLLNNT